MIFDELGCPRDSGSTDWQDSARLAGIVAVFGDGRVPITRYVQSHVNGSLKYVRHPQEKIYSMSRDQAVCLVAGLYFKDLPHLVNEKYIDGKDLLSPSVRGHFARCRGEKATWLQDMWLRLDIYWSAYVRPDEEINQLLCILMVAGPDWVKLFKKHHLTWRENLQHYWAGWRGEQGLCDIMIEKLEAI